MGTEKSLGDDYSAEPGRFWQCQGRQMYSLPPKAQLTCPSTLSPNKELLSYIETRR